MSTPTLIPDRRRQHFPRNGGPKPTPAERDQAQAGLVAARQALQAVQPTGPAEPTVVHRLTPEQIRQARLGLAAAREALRSSSTADDRSSELRATG